MNTVYKGKTGESVLPFAGDWEKYLLSVEYPYAGLKSA